MNINRFPLRAGNAARAFMTNNKVATIAERVESLNALAPAEVSRILSRMPQEYAVNILDRPELRNASPVLALMDRADAARLLHGMSNDRVADVQLELDTDTRTRLFKSLEEPVRVAIQHLIG